MARGAFHEIARGQVPGYGVHVGAMTARPSAGPSAQALFRFQVVSAVRTEQMGGCSRARAIARVARRTHPTLDGQSRKVSVRTLYRWVGAFERGGRDIAALESEPRPRVADSATLSERFVAFLRSEKGDDTLASVPELIERARERGVLSASEPVDRVTVWRAICRMGLPTRRRPSKHEGDTRRFAYPHRMQMVLCDGKHFRAGKGRLRRVALFFLDDCTRNGLHVVVGTDEDTELFLRGLYGVVQRHGMMDALYLDGGPGFISHDTWAVVSQLGVALVHGKERYPEGHGKIERFNRTAIAKVLRSLDGAAEVDPEPGALELRLGHFLGRYNGRPHESLGQDTPAMRWQADPRALQLPADDAALRARFVVTEERRVSNDHVIRYGGALYEAPRGLARQKVVVHRQLLSGQLSVLSAEGRMVALHPVDLAKNARAPRGRRREGEAATHEVAPVKTAATLAYERDFAPLVGPDGGFNEEQ